MHVAHKPYPNKTDCPFLYVIWLHNRDQRQLTNNNGGFNFKDAVITLLEGDMGL